MKRVLKYIRKYTPALVLSLLLAGLTVLLTLYIPILTGNAVDLIIGKGQVDMAGIFAIMKKIAIVMIITAVGQWVMNTCNNYITYHVIRDIRTDAFAKLEILPLKYLDAHAYGDIVSRVIADVDTFADGLLMGFTQLFTGALTILCTLGFMLVNNVPITQVVVCITPVSFLVAKFIATKTYSMFKEQSETRGEQTSLIEEMIDNQKIVNTFSRGEAVKSKFGEINGRLQKCSLKAIFFSSITNPATRFVNSLVYAGVGVFGALVAIKGGISVGRLSSFLSYANQYTKPFNEISGVVTELQNAFVCAGRIFELIDEEPQVPDAADARVLEEAQGNVDLKDVYFQYVPEKKLIQNFNLQVKAGQRVAIVGPTGCGKTYLVKTLAKLLDVPLAIADATSLTEAGYIGDDIESVVSKLLAAADNDVERAAHGIIFIDEIDKIAKKKNTNSRDVCGESVQQGMLKLLEGAEVEVPVGANSKNAMVPLATVNTRNILCICGGAFPDLDEIIKERLTKTASIGFNSELKDKYDKDTDILSKVTVEDIRKFGMIPEFIGRLPIICTLQGLSKEMLVKILKEPKNAILKQYQKLLELDEVKLEFTDDALDAIAEKAMKRDTGARALRSIIEDFMLDIMYEIPKDDNIGEVIITKEYIEGTGGPVIMLRGQEVPRLQ